MYSLSNLAPDDRRHAALQVRRLGSRSYADACALQERAARAVAAGGPDQLLIVGHPSVITLGRGTRAGQLRRSPEALARAGMPVLQTDRGGGATYHGPGQLIGYPIVDLRRSRRGVREFLRNVEAALVAVLRVEDIDAFVRPGLTGVWTAEGKICAIGIAVRRGITRHGFALNVRTDLSHFDHIVPCGLRQPVTSMDVLGWRGRMGSLGPKLAAELDLRLAAASFEGVCS